MIFEWTLQAQSDLQSILEYIASDGPTAAFALVDAITDGTENMLSKHPNAGGQGRVANTREWVVHKNYVVAYRMHDTKIQILSVMHSARLWPANFK